MEHLAATLTLTFAAGSAGTLMVCAFMLSLWAIDWSFRKIKGIVHG